MWILVYFIGYVFSVIALSKAYMMYMRRWGSGCEALIAAVMGGILFISLLSWVTYFLALIWISCMEANNGK